MVFTEWCFHSSFSTFLARGDLHETSSKAVNVTGWIWWFGRSTFLDYVHRARAVSGGWVMETKKMEMEEGKIEKET